MGGDFIFKYVQISRSHEIHHKTHCMIWKLFNIVLIIVCRLQNTKSHSVMRRVTCHRSPELLLCQKDAISEICKRAIRFVCSECTKQRKWAVSHMTFFFSVTFASGFKLASRTPKVRHVLNLRGSWILDHSRNEPTAVRLAFKGELWSSLKI